MLPEHRFVLVDFRCIGEGGAPRMYEAGRSYPMPPAVAHAAAKRNLVVHHRPLRWMPPSVLTPVEVLTEEEIATAQAELQQVEQHARQSINSVVP